MRHGSPALLGLVLCLALGAPIPVLQDDYSRFVTAKWVEAVLGASPESQ